MVTFIVKRFLYSIFWIAAIAVLHYGIGMVLFWQEASAYGCDEGERWWKCDYRVQFSISSPDLNPSQKVSGALLRILDAPLEPIYEKLSLCLTNQKIDLGGMTRGVFNSLLWGGCLYAITVCAGRRSE